jgi:hypothetical protein
VGKILLAVDPGIRGSGAALFDGDRLKAVAYVKNPREIGNRADEAAEMGHAIALWAHEANGWQAVDALVIEWPQIYAGRIRRGETKADPNDLLALAGVVSVVATEVDVVTHSYLPHEWKGSVDGDVMTRRIVQHLYLEEKVLVAEVRPRSLAHNAIDAVGLGLHHLGRLERKRVISTGVAR